MNSLQIQPVIPIWLILLLVAAATSATWLSLSRCPVAWKGRVAIFSMRVACFVLLGMLLLMPERYSVQESQQKPVLVVLRDVSASMVDSPADPDTVRIDTAARIIGDRRLQGLDDRYDFLYIDYGGELETAADKAPAAVDDPAYYNAPRTQVHTALNQLQQRHRGLNFAGVLLLTDGLDQSQEPLTLEARRVPVYIPTIEPPLPPAVEEAAEVWIDDVTHPAMLVVGWKGQVDVVIKRSGNQKVPVTVHLYRNGERVRTSYMVFEPGETARAIDFAIEPIEVGRIAYRVEIEPGADTDPGNNSRAFMVDVTDPQNRVLYMEGTLRWEFKFIKRALLKEKNFQLSAFVQSAPGVFMNFSEGDQQGQVGGLPELSTASTLKYRAIILGEMTADAFTPEQQKAIHDFVDKGGGLLFIGGRKAYGQLGWPSSREMEKLLPFTNTPASDSRDGRFPVSIEALGRSHPALSGLDSAGALPHVQSLWGPVTVRAAATPLLAAGDGEPLLLTMRYGKGKVAALMTDSLHTWQLAAPRLDEQKSLYEQFFSQLTYWLAPQEKDVQDTVDLQVVTAAAQVELREHVAIGAVMGQLAGPPDGVSMVATISTPDGRELRQEMVATKIGADVGLTAPVWGWRSAFEPHVAGEYTIVVREGTGSAEARARLLVVEPQRERTHAPVDRAFLARLAEQTHGRVFDPDDLGSVLKTIPYRPLSTRTTSQTPLWNKAWIIVLLLALFIGEWYVRGKLDMV